MIRKTKSFLRRFRRDEDGSIFVIEFVIMFPLVFALFLMSVELGVYSMRHMFLDRGLDITVRHVRLNTDTVMTHDTIKTMICDNSGFLDDCDNQLRLEMAPVDPRNFLAFNQDPLCVDVIDSANPERGVSLGMEHQMMILRACYLFDPVFPTSGLGLEFEANTGRARMISSALFVQEPN